MKITRHYKNFDLELDKEDFMSSVGQTIHEHIKMLPRHVRTWNFSNFSWTINNEYYQDIVNLKNTVVSFSKEEMELADKEFNNNWITQYGYSI